VKFEQGTGAVRPFDRNFWIYHLVLPLVAAILVLASLERTGVDLWLADRWYAFEGYHWALRNHWLVNQVIHRDGKELLAGLGLALAITLAASYRLPRLQNWRRPIAYLLTCMVVLPALIAGFKHFSSAPCPWDLVRYGGGLPYHHSLSYFFGAAGTGHCFPAGHASGGFALLALYFATYFYARYPAIYLLPGLLIGFTFAFGQEARGAHFISHDLWTLSLCWFGALGLFILFKPGGWKQPAVSKNQGVDSVR
jgi:membrane-associated PAP2 superfamily phosphatase